VADCGGIPDNSDAEPRDERIRAGDGAAAAHFATLPVVATVERLLDAGIPARVSNSAGTHLCNSILYQTRAYLEAEEKGGIPTGFVHLPLTPEDAAVKAQDSEAASGGGVQASMTLEMQVEAVERVFEAALDS
jgi:pyroglutamyl-peptidase